MRKSLNLLISFGFCMLLSYYMLLNRGLVLDAISRYWDGTKEFSEFAQDLTQKMISDAFAEKNRFVNLNGLYARLTLRRQLNEVIRQKDGSLTRLRLADYDPEARAENTADFADYLDEIGIPFIFVQGAYDTDMAGELMPEGLPNPIHTDTNRFLHVLSERGVDVLDTRPLFCANSAQIKEYFFRTDHHWTVEAAFRTYQLIAERLQELFPDESLSGDAVVRDNWTLNGVKQVSLGSRGKRVGRFFAGLDDFNWLIPNFKTEMSCMIPSESAYYYGDFSKAFLRMEYLSGTHLFETNNYNFYLGGQYPLVQNRAKSADSDLRLVVLGDSFSRPVQAFLSSLTASLDALEPRQSGGFSFAEYIEWTHPDAVIMLVNPSMMAEGEEFFQFQRPADAETFGREPLLVFDQNVFSSDEVIRGLENDTTYTLRYQRVETLEPVLYLNLRDTRNGAVIRRMMVEADEEGVWTFRTGNTENAFMQIEFSGPATFYGVSLEKR